MYSTHPKEFQPASCISLVYQLVCPRTIADQLGGLNNPGGPGAENDEPAIVMPVDFPLPEKRVPQKSRSTLIRLDRGKNLDRYLYLF